MSGKHTSGNVPSSSSGTISPVRCCVRSALYIDLHPRGGGFIGYRASRCVRVKNMSLNICRQKRSCLPLYWNLCLKLSEILYSLQGWTEKQKLLGEGTQENSPGYFDGFVTVVMGGVRDLFWSIIRFWLMVTGCFMQVVQYLASTLGWKGQIYQIKDLGAKCSTYLWVDTEWWDKTSAI